jgi:DNA-binding transcriptional LysR family regulator
MSGRAFLTEAGNALLPLCDSILAVAGEAGRALADLRAVHTGRVALAASQTVGTYVVPRLLAAFRARNPGVRARAPARRVINRVLGLSWPETMRPG